MPDPVSTAGDGGGRRDQRGRFGPGNRYGRGNKALRRLGKLQQAVRDAITPQDLRAVLRALQTAAASGDSSAASVLLAHVVGRPREAAPVIELELPADLSTSTGIVEALTLLLRETAAGNVPLDAAARLAGLVARVVDAGVLQDLEQRVAAIERER